MAQRMAVIHTAALAALLGLAGCSAADGPSFNISSTPTAPGDSLTIRRVLGDTATRDAVQTDPNLGWMPEEAPRTTLGNPDEAMRDIPAYNPVARPGLERDLRSTPAPTQPPAPQPRSDTAPRSDATPPPAPRGSSGPAPSAAVATNPIPGVQRVNPFAPPPPGPTASTAGQVVPVPGGGPVVTGAGSGGVSTYVQPGGPGGVIVQNGPGSATLLGNDGSVQVVPR